MSAVIRPIHLRGAAAFDALRLRAQSALDSWAHVWTRGASGAQGADAIQILAVDEQTTWGESDEFEILGTPVGRMCFRSGRSDRSRLGQATVGAESMLGEDYADQWIAEVVESARHARNRALYTALFEVPADEAPESPVVGVPESLCAVGSGAVLVSCTKFGLHAIADGGVWRNLPIGATAQQHPNLTPLDIALRGVAAQLQVMVGSVEIELPQLMDLRRGDVLRLPRRLDEDIDVLCEGQPMASAVLGTTRDRKCVQLTERYP
jgi:hypothetical protein